MDKPLAIMVGQWDFPVKDPDKHFMIVHSSVSSYGINRLITKIYLYIGHGIMLLHACISKGDDMICKINNVIPCPTCTLYFES